MIALNSFSQKVSIDSCGFYNIIICYIFTIPKYKRNREAFVLRKKIRTQILQAKFVIMYRMQKGIDYFYLIINAFFAF